MLYTDKLLLLSLSVHWRAREKHGCTERFVEREIMRFRRPHEEAFDCNPELCNGSRSADGSGADREQKKCGGLVNLRRLLRENRALFT